MSNKIKVIDDGNSIIGNKQSKQKFYKNSNNLNETIDCQETYTFSYIKDKAIILAGTFNENFLRSDNYDYEYVDFSTVFIEVDPQLVTSINNRYFILLRSTDNKSENYFEVTEHNNKYFIRLDFDADSEEFDKFSNSALKLLLFKCNADIEFIPYYNDDAKEYIFIVVFTTFYI